MKNCILSRYSCDSLYGGENLVLLYNLLLFVITGLCLCFSPLTLECVSMKRLENNKSKQFLINLMNLVLEVNFLISARNYYIFHSFTKYNFQLFPYLNMAYIFGKYLITFLFFSRIVSFPSLVAKIFLIICNKRIILLNNYFNNTTIILEIDMIKYNKSFLTFQLSRFLVFLIKKLTLSFLISNSSVLERHDSLRRLL